ncbi:nucleotidyltransferase family protein [Taibaiella koreensis]|uniref:nucleotidyltransferase family protein n=1 Tax=Taibaiella koreensis TaxID=1268548 RepID=UPI000E59A5B1|nr:nucleotidyltransferase family protein [Taibaiella koreensis]
MKALLLSAGLGTRLKPFTDHHPKALAPVNGRSLLEWNIRNLQRFGIYDVVINVHHFAQQIIDVLEAEKGFGSRIEISDETDAVLETGGGLMKAAPFLEQEPVFLVMNVDILTNTDIGKLIAHHREHPCWATLAVQQRSSSRYFLFDEQLELKGWENVQTGEVRLPAGVREPSWSSYAFSGIHAMSPALLQHIRQKDKFSLVDVYLDLCSSGQIRGWDHTGDLLIDVGKPESLEKASSLFAHLTL